MQPTLGFEMAETMRFIIRNLRHRTHEKGLELGLEQYALLHLLNISKDELILQDIAEFLGKDKAAINRQLNILEKKKLIARIPDPADKRRKMLIVTRRGVEFYQDFHLIDIQMNQDLLKDIPEAELKQFIRVLHQIRSNAASNVQTIEKGEN
jgi:DNA-binding MarR family transcriptional regulator